MGCSKTDRYPGLRLSQPPVSVLRHHRRSHPRASLETAHMVELSNPDIPRPCLSHHFQCSTPHPLVPSENLLSCRVAMVLTALVEGLDSSAAERVFGYRQATITSLSDSRSPCMHRPCTSAPSATSGSHIFSWTNCEPGCAAPHR